LGGRAPLNLLGDYAGGGVVAAFGIACALLEARASGRGQVVDAAMVDGVALLTAKLQGLRAAGLVPDEPGTSFLDGAAPFYGTYRCADGRDVAVGALEPDFYAQLVAGLVGELGMDATTWPDHGDRAQWPRLRDLLTEAFARRTRDEWTAVFAETDACVNPVLTFDEAADQHVYTRIDGVLHPAPAPVFDRTPADPPSAPRAAPRDVQELVELWSSSAHPTT
jgi:alpha-methylacyl-CoA racemase